jgi:hypothetical protein
MIISRYILPILKTNSYSSLSDGEKGYFLSELLKDIRTDAREISKAEAPELFMNLELKRTPKREQKLLKSQGMDLQSLMIK